MRSGLAGEAAIQRASVIPCRSCISCRTIVMPVTRGPAPPAASISVLMEPLRAGLRAVLSRGISRAHRGTNLCHTACRPCPAARSIPYWPGSIRERSTINQLSIIQYEADLSCVLFGGGPAVYRLRSAVFHQVGFRRVLFQNGAGGSQGRERPGLCRYRRRQEEPGFCRAAKRVHFPERADAGTFQ